MRDVTVKEMQQAIADIHIFSQSELCPNWATTVVGELGHLLESILCAREYPPKEIKHAKEKDRSNNEVL